MNRDSQRLVRWSKRGGGQLRLALVAGILVAGTMAPSGALSAPSDGPSVEVLIETTETILGQEFAYPEGRARITAVRITVPEGAKLSWHEHPVPTFGYIVQGTLEVDYGERGTRTYREGDSLVEAIDWRHRGRNAGSGEVVILVVYAGAEGVDHTEVLE